jgi:hypothetical protein
MRRLVYASAVPRSAESTPDALVVRSERILAERVHDETLVLDLSTERCTRLNQSGSVLWEALPCTVADLASRLEREFAVDPARARADAEAFVAKLSARGLIRHARDGAS